MYVASFYSSEEQLIALFFVQAAHSITIIQTN
jgi:hypothetical protein